jgi:hypothetical protein
MADLLSAGLQEFPNPTDSCGLVYGPTGAILAFDRRPVLKKQQDDLTLFAQQLRGYRCHRGQCLEPQDETAVSETKSLGSVASMNIASLVKCTRPVVTYAFGSGACPVNFKVAKLGLMTLFLNL